MYIILISIIIISGGGMIFLIMKRLKEVRMMPPEEFLSKLDSSQSVFSDFNERVIVRALDFWRASLLPRIYKESEKLISRFRINVLKIEGLLLKLTNYIRGKRKMQGHGGQSSYWKDINEFKNNLHGDDKKPE